ncbi:hypothetical protein HS088_TW13G00227 [Tripterygium wilfordii]|uniref:WRC domain-containing protein n=1 Tax=Tripterygium wilfordii TaxID=458696 RepID=A0A7J7CTM1_TRIWF|nr:uncharacterized protein LOC120012157 [Tripterygium wilfordii]KAF5737348.1 hypothetical protein HS088_TW13G00227 [Tripterygium wilfordii]
MRIRKRQVPLPLSSLSPLPLSDPHYFRPSPGVQLQPHNQVQPHGILSRLGATSTQSGAPPSDHSNQPIGRRDSPDAAGGAQEKKKKIDCMTTLLLKEDERGGEEDTSHDFRKGSSSSAAYMATVDLAQTYSSEAVGSWCEGEKAFPLKKRRGSFDRPTMNKEETIMEKNKKMKTKMKTKMNKKPCVKPSENGQEDEDQNDQEEKKRKEGAKKRGRGAGELMEGSRCSRVNGRGWRCCQQTLVGYSLCEHHLGKGRLRSMNSVRSRSVAATTSTISPPQNAVPAAAISIPSSEREEEHNEDEKKPSLMGTRKRVKLGMVKARSISSLLGENINDIAATSTMADKDQNDVVNNEGAVFN